VQWCKALLPLAGGRETVEVDQRDAMNYGVADLDHAAKPGQGSLIDLFVGQKFRIAEEVPEEPPQFPDRLLATVQTPDNRLAGQFLGFEDREESRMWAARLGTWRFMRPPPGWGGGSC
jgi:hypothetical protein